MIWHPLVLVLMVCDGLTLVACATATVHHIIAIGGWDANTFNRDQLRREVALQRACWLHAGVFWFFVGGAFVLAVLISNVLPGLVAGAMCGTGVLQAMGAAGPSAVLYRLLAGLIFFYGHRLVRLAAQVPSLEPLQAASRTYLAAVPVLMLALWSTWQGLAALQHAPPVSCCAVIYHQAAPQTASGWGQKGRTGLLLAAYLFSGLGLVLAAAFGLRRQKGTMGFWQMGLLLASLIWTPLAAVTLIRCFSAAIFQVLDHHCPWCLLLPEHGMVGWLLYPLLLLVAGWAPLGWLGGTMARRFPALKYQALDEFRRAAWTVLCAGAGFMAASAAPALVWRLRFGLWLGWG